MNNLILQNKASLKNEEHPSYLAFVVALVAGMFVATFAFLMLFLNFYNIKDFGFSNLSLLEGSFDDYALMLSQTWLNDSDTALLYLTLDHFSKCYLNVDVMVVTITLSRYIFYGSFLLICFFIVTCQWFILFSLPFITVSRWNILKWFFSLLILTVFMFLITILYQWYGSEMAHVKFDGLKLPILINSLNAWSINTYEVWFSVLLIFSSRILSCSIVFTLFMLVTTLKSWSRFIENSKFINRWNNSMVLRIENQPKFLLISMIVSTFLLPYYFSFLESFISNLFLAIIVLISSMVIFLLNLTGLNDVYFLFKKLFETFIQFSEIERLLIYVKQHPVTTAAISTGSLWGVWKCYDTAWEVGSRCFVKAVKYATEDTSAVSNKQHVKPSSALGIQLDQVDNKKVESVGKRVAEIQNKNSPLQIKVTFIEPIVEEPRK